MVDYSKMTPRQRKLFEKQRVRSVHAQQRQADRERIQERERGDVRQADPQAMEQLRKLFEED